MRRTSPRLPLASALVLAAAGCGSGAPDTSAAPGRPGSAATTAAAPRSPARAAGFVASDWPTFDRTPSRSGTTTASGISAADAPRLRRVRVALPGTVDSSPIYLHGVRAGGATRDVFVMTTTYGRTLALDAATARILWTFTPPGIGGWAGSYRITNASPTADPDRLHVFAASPDGRIHRLRLADGTEEAGWPVSVTRDPAREKLPSSLNVIGGRIVVATGGYVGDAPPYQGHVVTLDRRTGRIDGVFNTLCSERHALQTPDTCPQSGDAMWARSGVVAAPHGRLLVATGDGRFDGRRFWGDSVLELAPAASRLLQNWTPRTASELEATDTDLGSTGPVLLDGAHVLQSGKFARIVVLSLRRLNGHAARPGSRTGGELQSLPAPGGDQMVSAPAVWHHAGRTTVFATTGGGTAAYRFRGGRLRRLWSVGLPGTSPVLAGGLLYVYDPAGALVVLRPGDGRTVARLAAAPGHWNSPVPGEGRIALPEGNANDHAQTGTLSLYVRP